MAQLLHEDGGREFKESLVSGLLNLATTLPDLKDRGGGGGEGASLWWEIDLEC